MRHLWISCWLGVAAACGSPAPMVSGPSEPSALTRADVSIDDFVAAQAKGAVIVDVRTDEEWQGGHVPGAVHVPVDQVDPENNTIKTLDKTKPVYFICATGGRSARAADRMAAAGYQAISVLGGTKAWIEKGLPLDMPTNPSEAPSATPAPTTPDASPAPTTPAPATPASPAPVP